jgi:small subunit ribosomal protein S1
LQVIVAENAGFCTGVKQAVKCLLEEAGRSGEGSTLGPLVHNDQVTAYLAEQGISSVNEPSEAKGSFLAVRTHGISPGRLAELKERGKFKIIDLTCPRVRRVQKIAAELADNGAQVVIYGDSGHPEVQGLIGWAGRDAIVISSPEDLENAALKKPSALIAQTTGSPEQYKKIIIKYKELNTQGLVYDTICPETVKRQEESAKLAQRVEALVVVGSSSSANTKALYECCRQLKPSCLVTNARELDRSFLRQYELFGVTAGASTPPWTIKEVVERMENENMESKNEEQFSYEGEVKVVQIGEQVTGKVARVTGEEVFVDIGAKTEAILPAGEVHLDEGKSLTDIFSPEDEIEVTVLENDEQEGKVVVSHKRMARDKRLKELEEALENETILEGKVKQVVPAGIVVDLGSGIEGFMPGSLVDTRYIPDFNEFKDQVIQFKVLEYDREKGKLILSRRKIMEEENLKLRESTLSAIKVGTTINGVVKRLTDFGAFVDVGGIDGLVHISELSWERVSHPSEVLKVGDKIDVKVLEIIPEKERISLSIRKTQPDPWTRAVKELETDQVITGKVTRLVNFGAFIEIKPGVEGLAHISQLADYHVKHPSEILKEGEEVEVKILEVKPKAKRISLSLKDAGGVSIAPGSMESSGMENGNVTLGDLFGSMFAKEDYSANEKAAEEEPESEEKAGEFFPGAAVEEPSSKDMEADEAVEEAPEAEEAPETEEEAPEAEEEAPEAEEEAPEAEEELAAPEAENAEPEKEPADSEPAPEEEKEEPSDPESEENIPREGEEE